MTWMLHASQATSIKLRSWTYLFFFLISLFSRPLFLLLLSSTPVRTLFSLSTTKHLYCHNDTAFLPPSSQDTMSLSPLTCGSLFNFWRSLSFSTTTYIQHFKLYYIFFLYQLHKICDNFYFD